MKKLTCLAFLFLIVTPSIFGQMLTMTKEQYETVMKNAQLKTEAVLRRVVSEEKTYNTAGMVESTKTLSKEIFPNGDNRWNLIRKKGGQVTEKLQLIYFGKYEYRKEGENDWKKKCVKDCSPSEASGGMSFKVTESPKVEEYLTSEDTISGNKARMYLYSRASEINKVLEFYTSRTWIGSNGLILKEDSLNAFVLCDIGRFSEVITYEYEPKDIVPIEAPIK